ncbi:metal-sensitive transcriptional regulator [Bacillus timonensis]|nr:metal-sensitive transcriptional regulator [Bacillus timonensis]
MEGNQNEELENILLTEDCCSSHSDRKSHHSDKTKKNLISRLNRIEGQIRGVKGLIEKDTYCDDVITQIAAAQSALNSVSKLLLEGHLKTCVIDRIQEGDLEVLDEVLVTVHKLMKK